MAVRNKWRGQQWKKHEGRVTTVEMRCQSRRGGEERRHKSKRFRVQRPKLRIRAGNEGKLNGKRMKRGRKGKMKVK